MKWFAGFLFLVVLILLAIGGERERQIGKIQLAMADDVRVVAAERARGDSIDRQFRVDTVRTFRSIATIDTLIQTRIETAIVRQTDTVWITIREAVAIQDTLRACRATVVTCAEGWASAQRENAALQAQTRRLEALVPSKVGNWLRCGVGAGLGAAGGGAVAAGQQGAILAAGGALAGCFLLAR